MRLTSSVFLNSRSIPKRYTGDAEDVSPPLNWTAIPEGVREFAILCEDPDAPKRPLQEHPFVHWLIYGISPTTTSLPEGLPALEKIDLPVRALQGLNSFKRIGYSGPLPPPGHGTHRYIFTLFALNAELPLKPGVSRDEFLRAARPHILRETRITGTYERFENEIDYSRAAPTTLSGKTGSPSIQEPCG